MANGDAALAAGYPVVSGDADRRQGFDEINITRDMFAKLAAAGGIPMRSGHSYAAPTANTQTAINAEGSMRGGLLTVGVAGTLNQIAIEIVTGGTSGALVRLGIYDFNPSTGVATLLVDAGTVDGVATGIKTASISQAVTAGQTLLLTATPQGGAGTRSTLRMHVGSDPRIGDSAVSTLAATMLLGYQVASVSGSLPSTPTLALAGSGSIPRVMVRAA